MSLKFESLEDNLFFNEKIDKNQLSKIYGGQGFTSETSNTYVLQNGDYRVGIDICSGCHMYWGPVMEYLE